MPFKNEPAAKGPGSRRKRAHTKSKKTKIKLPYTQESTAAAGLNSGVAFKRATTSAVCSHISASTSATNRANNERKNESFIWQTGASQSNTLFGWLRCHTKLSRKSKPPCQE